MFWEKYFSLCSEIGKSPNAVASELGYSSGSVSAWKNGRVPKWSTIEAIAEYFDVTPSYLVEKSEPEANDSFDSGGGKMFYKNFLALCDAVGKKPNQVTKEIGLSTSMASEWKKGREPRDSTLVKLSTYFGVPLESLTADDPPELPEEPAPTLIAMDESNTYMIPLYENVSAGFGTLAHDCIVDHVPLYFKTKSEAERTICIRVKGDSMSPLIEDGDIVQVRKQDTVDSGALAVVIIDSEEGFLKYITYNGDELRLRSVNPAYKPIIFRGEDTLRVRVVGLVKTITKTVSGREHPVYPLVESEDKAEFLRLLGTFDEAQLKEVESFMNYLASKPKKP